MSCDSAVYIKPPMGIPAVLEVLPNLETGGGSNYPKRLCIRNVGRATGQVRFTAGNVTETELTCEADEVDPAAGNDQTCVSNADGTTTGAGELGAHLDLAVLLDGANPAGCGSSQLFPFSSIRPTATNVQQWRTLAPEVPAGVTCRYRWQGQIILQTTDQQRFAAQTDEVRWSFQFNLEDIPPA